MIPLEILEKYDAVRRLYKKSEVIFDKDKLATHYYQIISGVVKMNNFNDEDREFIQGFFYAKHCFGEPPLFLNRTYPANAEAIEDSELICISKTNFLKLISENPSVSIMMIENLAQRLHYKSVMAAEISTQDSEHRLLQLFDYSIAYFNFKKEERLSPESVVELCELLQSGMKVMDISRQTGVNRKKIERLKRDFKC